MKIRTGFVSNSSSSSFVIKRCKLKKRQINAIKNHIELGRKLVDNYGDRLICDEYDRWSILDDGNEITGFTSMDNFNMRFFLEEYLHIDPQLIIWDD